MTWFSLFIYVFIMCGKQMYTMKWSDTNGTRDSRLFGKYHSVYVLGILLVVLYILIILPRLILNGILVPQYSAA